MLKDIESMNHFTKRFMYKYSILGGGGVKNMFPHGTLLQNEYNCIFANIIFKIYGRWKCVSKLYQGINWIKVILGKKSDTKTKLQEL